MILASKAFQHTQNIPSKYTCDGQDTSPPLDFSEVPEEAKSLALIMDDPDIPEEIRRDRGIEVFDHWVVFNLDPKTERLEEGTEAGIQGLNSSGGSGYTGPCPPPQFEPKQHRYIFQLYALDKELELLEGADKTELLEAMEGYVLDQAELIGLYSRE